MGLKRHRPSAPGLPPLGPFRPADEGRRFVSVCVELGIVALAGAGVIAFLLAGGGL